MCGDVKDNWCSHVTFCQTQSFDARRWRRALGFYVWVGNHRDIQMIACNMQVGHCMHATTASNCTPIYVSAHITAYVHAYNNQLVVLTSLSLDPITWSFYWLLAACSAWNEHSSVKSLKKHSPKKQQVVLATHLGRCMLLSSSHNQSMHNILMNFDVCRAWGEVLHDIYLDIIPKDLTSYKLWQPDQSCKYTNLSLCSFLPPSMRCCACMMLM